MLYNSRNEIEDKYKWNLEDIIDGTDCFNRLFLETAKCIDIIPQYEGKLSDEDVLFDYLEYDARISSCISKLYTYAKMHQDENTADSTYQTMTDRVRLLISKIAPVSSFATPEISAFSLEKLNGIKNNPKFSDYSVVIENIIRQKNIILSKEEEKIISEVSLFADSNEEVFAMFDNADIKWKPIKDEKGNKVELSHGVYSLMLQNPNQKVREAAFNSMFEAYKDHINTIAANYAGNVKKDWFYAKIRGFKSTLAYSMYQENVEDSCYKKLLEYVGKSTKPMHDYIALRKDVLKLGKLNMYDLYTPMIKDQNIAMPYENAVELVKDALSVMGKEYSDILASSFKDGWIDVFESKGKRSGAYSWGVYGVHPYVLLNYQETIHDIFTIAHELGHAMHSFFSNMNQPEPKAGYEIFVAEIASTVNEVLLLKHLLKTASGEFKKYLLTYYLDMFRTTLFRQTMFSEFEEFAHRMVENGEPINAENLSAYYLELNKKYYGPAVIHNDLIKYEWARIPHFYSSFYVYKYATGLTSAVTIASNILKYGAPYFEKYKKFLSAGGSMPPLDILKLADVDLTTDEPYKNAMAEFENTLKELKESF